MTALKLSMSKIAKVRESSLLATPPACLQVRRRNLANSRSAQIPLHESLAGMKHPLPLETLRPMRVDYAKVGALIKQKHDEFRELFLE